MGDLYSNWNLVKHSRLFGSKAKGLETKTKMGKLRNVTKVLFIDLNLHLCCMARFSCESPDRLLSVSADIDWTQHSLYVYDYIGHWELNCRFVCG